MDLGAAALPGKQDSGLVAGLAVKNGNHLEHVIRDAIKDFSAAERQQYELIWNFANHKGSRIHGWSLPTGPFTVFAIRENYALAALGPGTAKKYLDLLEEKPADEAPIQIVMRPGFLMFAWLAADQFLSDPESAGRVLSRLRLGDSSWGTDWALKSMQSPRGKHFQDVQRRLGAEHVLRISVRGGEDLRVAVEINAQLLRLASIYLPK
ncbi:MAG: hypothetical protein L0215_16735 [Gemmataceae bacterium]|nr:hypothetical protein [Gemmataceae bacterium]